MILGARLGHILLSDSDDNLGGIWLSDEVAQWHVSWRALTHRHDCWLAENLSLFEQVAPSGETL